MNYGTLIFNVTQLKDRVSLNYVEALNITTRAYKTLTGGVDKILYDLSCMGVDCFFLLNAGQFFGFIDYYATNRDLPIYDTLKDDSGQRKKITREAWAHHDGEGAQYSRKLWLKSSLPNTRHKRIHAVSFLNFSTVVAVNTVEELCDTLHVDKNLCIGNKPYGLACCLLRFDEFYYRITDTNFLGNSRPACWTMGGAARNFYLKLRYPEATTNRLKLYHYGHPQNMKLEYFLRECKLLPSGLLYTKDRKTLHEGKFYKYDKNSLFAQIERELPELGALTKSSYNEYKQDKTGWYEYIFIVDLLELKARPGMPRVFYNPFERYTNNAERVEISQKWAVFAPFLEALKDFYIIEDLAITSVYRARKNKDNAIVKYVDTLYDIKQRCRKERHNGLATLVKFFLVNLHGKFAQKSITVPKYLSLDEDTQTVVKTEGDEIIDEWEYKHFDYVRGAYIYTMARVDLMKNLLRFKEVLPAGDTLEAHIFYDDTDSIITDLKGPDDIVDPYALGKFKLEEVYTAFECIAPKTYWGRTEANEIKLTCAGMDSEEVFATLRVHYSGLYPHNINSNYYFHKYFSGEYLYPCTLLTRMQGGSGYVTNWRPLSTFDTDEIF